MTLAQAKPDPAAALAGYLIGAESEIRRADIGITALQAWQRSPAAKHWPKQVDTVMLAVFEGEAIVWPGFETECFDIIRVRDSAVLSEEALASRHAFGLRWKRVSFSPPISWA